MSDTEGANNNELLMHACRQDALDILEEVLSSDTSSFDINYTDGVGNSALHYAASCGSRDCLEIVLYYDGIDVNITNRLEGDTPLHKAAGFSDPKTSLEMVQILIGGGASAKIRNKLKQTARDVAPSDTHSKVREFLEQAELTSQIGPRDVAADDDADSDGVASDDD